MQAEGGATIIAGGTELIQLLQEGIAAPEAVVDINDLPFRDIASADDGGVRIGALARMNDIADDPTIRDRFAAVSEAARETASVQVRNMATAGGNILQRTRCLYFRDMATPCNKREPGVGCGAIGGENRINAIFGGSDSCIAVHPSDLAVALVACDGAVELCGPTGIRQVAADDFFVLPGETPHIETVMEPGELIRALVLPGTAAGRASGYLKVRDRSTFEWALVSCAASVRLSEDGNVAEARVVAGGVAPKPWRLHAVEERLAGRQLDEANIREAAALATRGAAIRERNGYKVPMLERAVARELAELART